MLPCSATSVSPVALKMLQVKNADGSYYFPTHTTSGDALNFSSPALFSENQHLINADYLINAKNTLAMKEFYSSDPRTINFNSPLAARLPEPRRLFSTRTTMPF